MRCFLGFHNWFVIGLDKREWLPRPEGPWRILYQCTRCKKKRDEPAIVNQIDFRSK